MDCDVAVITDNDGVVVFFLLLLLPSFVIETRVAQHFCVHIVLPDVNLVLVGFNLPHLKVVSVQRFGLFIAHSVLAQPLGVAQPLLLLKYLFVDFFVVVFDGLLRASGLSRWVFHG